MAGPGLAVQLYTVRDLTAADFAGTVARIAEIGYRNVELAGFGNFVTAGEVRRALDANGVKAVSAHYAMDVLESDIGKVIGECQSLGLRHVVMPWLAQEQRPTDLAGWRRLADRLSLIGQRLGQRGLSLAYHNHDFEFTLFAGKPALDWLFENTDARDVRAELDVYWIAYAGFNPAEYIMRISGRLPLLHLKDLAPGPDKRFAPVGTGLLDFPAILAAAARAGVEWAIVEQDDTYDLPPLEAIRISLEKLRAMGLVVGPT